MKKYPTKDYLDALYIKINHVSIYENDDPVEYIWHLFNTENGVYKDVFSQCGLTRFDIRSKKLLYLKHFEF
jgi:hypothetical protein